MFMSKKALVEFYEQEIDDAYKTGVMFSLHVKATMMKVSHPIVFGHCVKIFYRKMPLPEAPASCLTSWA